MTKQSRKNSATLNKGTGRYKSFIGISIPPTGKPLITEAASSHGAAMKALRVLKNLAKKASF